MTALDEEEHADQEFIGWVARAEAELAAKAKPVGSLGLLEALATRLAALQRTLRPCVGRTCLLVFGADHGITAARPQVSAFPRSVSAPVFRAVVRGQAASAVLCAANSCCDLMAVDVGLAADVTDAVPPGPLPAGQARLAPRIAVLHKKVRPEGSRNMLEGPAMTEEELQAAMLAGAEAVQAAVWGQLSGAARHDMAGVACEASLAGACSIPGGDMDSLPADWRSCVVCLGEIGIGNTTAAAALLAGLTGSSPEEVCGRGTGVDDVGLAAKRAAVAGALAANAELIKNGGALGALRAVGGLELAAIAGAVLEAARLGLPVVVDGFICGAAALAALAHSPGRVGRALILSHRSSESGASLLLSSLVGTRPLLPTAIRKQGEHHGDRGCREGAGAGGEVQGGTVPSPPRGPTPAVLDLGLRLGEGSGAVLMLPLLRSAAAIMCDMATLAEVLAG